MTGREARENTAPVPQILCAPFARFPIDTGIVHSGNFRTPPLTEP